MSDREFHLAIREAKAKMYLIDSCDITVAGACRSPIIHMDENIAGRRRAAGLYFAPLSR